MYEPGKEVSIDEAMIPFKARSSFKQYMPLKPVEHRIKVWARADASNGYVSAFQVYTGKSDDTIEQGLGARGNQRLDTRPKGYTQAYLL